MHGSRLTPYPHLTWLAFALEILPPPAFLLHEYRASTHLLLVTKEGDANVAWASGDAAAACHATSGSLGFFPRDDAEHSLAISATGVYRAHALLVPSWQLGGVCQAEDARHKVAFRVRPAFQDALLLAFALRLLAEHPCGHLAEDVGAEIAARQIILRIAAIYGGRAVDWLDDKSVFSPSVMTRIVERVDATLQAHASLQDISTGFGISPGHFARKFRQSTGLSLHRFIQRRRIRLSLALLKTSREPLARLSLELGFCSQSHFTRVFTSLTGLSPHQFRRTQRRVSE